MKKKAVITGMTGQDGSYLAEFLLKKGYDIVGVTRQKISWKSPEFWRIRHLEGRVKMRRGSVGDENFVKNLVAVRPDEIYHLAGQKQSQRPEEETETIAINAMATQIFLAALKRKGSGCRFFGAGSSEIFGKTKIFPQNEKTPYAPISVYGVAKAASLQLTRIYREAYGVFACTGILFNHESPRRNEMYVTRKITHAAAGIRYGKECGLNLGNLNARRDWGFAGDYVEAMWLMLQEKEPDDYVIGTGRTHTVKEFTERAFGMLGLDWKKYVSENMTEKRRNEPENLVADIEKAKKHLRWKPKTSFEDLVRMMVEEDVRRVREEKTR